MPEDASSNIEWVNATIGAVSVVAGMLITLAVTHINQRAARRREAAAFNRESLKARRGEAASILCEAMTVGFKMHDLHEEHVCNLERYNRPEEELPNLDPDNSLRESELRVLSKLRLMLGEEITLKWARWVESTSLAAPRTDNLHEFEEAALRHLDDIYTYPKSLDEGGK